MRKELIIAIIAGIIVGLTIAFGVWRANSALKKVKVVTKEPTSLDQKRSVSQNGSSKITLAAPEAEDVITQNPTKVSGITLKDALVVVSSEEEDYILKADASGSFEQEVELIGGINQLIVASFDESEGKSEQELTVIFSREFKVSEEGSGNPTATDEGDPIREKVREKLEEVKKNPKAYIGTITDKLETSLQIKNALGEIQLISVDSENVDFVKTSKSQTTIKYNDLAIGDFIIAMGFATNSNGVLAAQRILVSPQLEAPKREIVFGQATGIAKNVLSLKDKQGKEWKLTFPKKWKGPEIKEVKEGEKVVAIVEQEENIYNIRTIEITSKVETSSN